MSEYLDEEEQLARAKSWWDENANSVIGGVVLVVGGIVGWNWFGDYSVTQKHDATRAYTAYVEAPDEAKEIQLETLSEDFGGSAVHLFALFDQASIALNDGDPEKAKSLLETAVEVGSDTIVVDLARIRLAKLQRELDLADEALATLDGVRNEGYRSLVLEAKGDIHASRGEIELAHQSYQAAVESLLPGDNRPFLDMKLDNTAPFAGEYVAMTDNLSEALRAAEETLQAAEEAAEDAAAEEIDEQTVDQMQEAVETAQDSETLETSE